MKTTDMLGSDGSDPISNRMGTIRNFGSAASSAIPYVPPPGPPRCDLALIVGSARAGSNG